MNNLEIIVWIPIVCMILALIVWWILLHFAEKIPAVKSFSKKHQVFGMGCLFISTTTFVFLIVKALTSPILRPVLEVAPRATRPVVQEVVEIPKNLEDKTLKAKPKDVISTQPETPLVNKAVKDVQ